MKEKSVKRNLRAYYYGKIGFLALMLPAVVLTWQKDGMSFAEILYLQGLFGLVILIMEFPSGIIADIADRKKVLAVSRIFIGTGAILYSLVHGFKQFLMAETLIGIGLASYSGTDNAAIWDTFKQIGDEKSAEKHLIQARMTMMGSGFILFLVGGMVMDMNSKMPFYVAGLGEFTVAILYMMSSEPTRAKVEKASAAWVQSMDLLKNPDYLIAVGLILIVALNLRIAFWAYIPKMQKYGLKTVVFGFVYAGANLVAMISTSYARFRHAPKNKELGIFGIIAGLGCLLFVIDNSLIVMLIGIAFHQLARGMFGLMASLRVNRVVESQIRASAESLMGAIASLVYMMTTWIIYIFNASLEESMKLNLALFVILGLGILMIHKIK